MKNHFYVFTTLSIALCLSCVKVQERNIKPIDNSFTAQTDRARGTPERSIVTCLNYDQLNQAVANAGPGIVIQISADIDFQNNTLLIQNKSSLILESAGLEKQLIYSDDKKRTIPLIDIVSSRNITIRNLRMRGNNSSASRHSGIHLWSSKESIMIENCELSNFKEAAVSLTNADPQFNSHAVISHNHIHDCTSNDYGYGVLLGNGSNAKIEHNTFDKNRHDIAGDGFPGTGYEACYNTCSNYTSHSFDMHGNAQRSDPRRPNDHTSGKLLKIYNNTFSSKKQKAIVIRGVPDDRCDIHDNTFAHDCANSAIEQRVEDFFRSGVPGILKDEPEAYRKMFKIPSNTYKGTTSEKTFQIFSNNQWSRLIKVNKDWTLDDLAFGDFNGDGITDLFSSEAGKFYIYWSGFADKWQANALNMSMDRLAFGDFNNDRKTDVFASFDGQWWVSYSATSAWTRINASTDPVSELLFYDWNGDGATDVIRETGADNYEYFNKGAGLKKVLSAGAAISAEVLKDRRNLHRTWRDFDGDGTNEPLEALRIQ